MDAPGSKSVIRVELGARSYDVQIGAGLIENAGAVLRPLAGRMKTAVITDSNVADLHLDRLHASLAAAGLEPHPIVLPAGEATKSFDVLADVCDRLLEAGVERGDLVVAFGGGVIGDLAGFAAAILRRGVRFAQVPTTLLAQVDSSVGGKTGINTKHGKNLIGAFHQPAIVLADTGVLGTLPERQFQAGYAEVAKYGLIVDAPFFAWLEQNREAVFAQRSDALSHAIAVACETKARVVAEDERETGARALLNLGHTFGHALEAVTGYSDRLLHGEAVAIGMVMAFEMSRQLGHCDDEAPGRVEAHLKAAGLPTRVGDISGAPLDVDEVIAAMTQDKKAEAGRMVFILARAIGEAFVSRDVSPETVRNFIDGAFSRS